MNKEIAISLFRISSDSLYLDMLIDCPSDYHFTSATLTVKELISGDLVEKKFDLTDALFDSKNAANKHHWDIRLPIEALGVSNPAMYYAKFVAENDQNKEIKTKAVCSDVNNAYRCMLEDILSLTGSCDPISDDVIRKYLLLYGHQAALYVEDPVSEEYFKLIGNCFNSCPTDGRSNINHLCNCGK